MPKIINNILEKPNDTINHNNDNIGFDTVITNKLDKAANSSTQFSKKYNNINLIINYHQ